MNRPTKYKSGQLTLYAAFLIAAILCMMALRHCSTPPAGQGKESRASGGDTIDVAISYSPMALYRYADTLGGFSYDMLRCIATETGLTLKFHPVTSLDNSLKGLREELYDVVVWDVAKTVDIDSAFTFTHPVSFDKQVLLQVRDNTGNLKVRSQLDLAGKKVWVEDGSPVIQRIENLSAEIGDTVYIERVSDYSSEQLAIMTALGEIPFAVVNEAVARQLAPSYPQLDMSTEISFTQFQAWIMRSADKPTLNRINAAIDSFKLTRAFTELNNRYGLSNQKSQK